MFNFNSEDIYQILDIVNASIYWKDKNGYYLGCNEYGLKVLGVNNRAQIIGKTDKELFTNQDFLARLAEIDKIVLEHGTYNGEEYATINGENRVYLSTKMRLLDSQNNVIIFGTSIDISAQKETELLRLQNLELEKQQIIDLVDVSIYWKDKDGHMLGCNQYALDIFGFVNRKDILGKTEYDLLPKNEADKVNAADKLVLERGGYSGEELATISSGEQRIFFTAKNRLLDNQGNLLGLIGTSVDITAQKEAERKLSESQAQFKKIAAQVAHDISSPLAALKMVVPHCDALPENTRNVLNKSAIRIADIAENFLSQFKPREDENDTKATRVPTLISAELLEVLTEKKYEYSQLAVDFIVDISPLGAFAFINIDQRAFKRMISNLINNAVDAFDSSAGQVIVSLNNIDNQVQVTVADNGKGMPESVKEKILNNIEITAGKADGHGIGFTQIRDTLNDNEGKLSIETQLDFGTKIILTFPKVTTPEWIAEKIELQNNNLVVILDDDDSIHDAWETRFEKSAPNIKRKHFKHGDETIEFINNLNSIEKEQVVLLTDYELLRQRLNGFNVIEQTKIERSILVTSHHNNQTVREQAKSTNTKILPKPLASEIQILIMQNNQSQVNYIEQFKKVDLVILDDDKNLIEAILMFAIDDNVIVDKYYTTTDFMNSLKQYAKDTKFLIDNQYKNETITGIAIAKQLHELGYTNLNLFSGEYFDVDSAIPNYLNVVSKHDSIAVKNLLKSKSTI